jgi:hypothetical protein
MALGTHKPAAPPWRWLVLIIAAVVLICLSVRAAHGENLGPTGGSRVIVGDEVRGSYRLLVTSAPNPATVGTITYVVRVSDPSSGEKIRDAQVEVELTLPESASAVKEAATHQNAGNQVDYAAHIAIDREGMWHGRLLVTGAAGASEVEFLQQVTPQRSFNTVILMGIPFVVILGVFAAMWLFRSSGRKAQSFS